MVLLSDLKLQEVRKVIMVNIDGKICPVTIKNLLGDKREECIEQMQKDFEAGKKDEEINEAFYTKIFIECTDLVIDDSVLEMLENPSGAMIQVIKEVLEMLHELQCEMMLRQLMQLNTIEESLYAENLILKSSNVQELSKENAKLREEAVKRTKVNDKKKSTKKTNKAKKSETVKKIDKTEKGE